MGMRYTEPWEYERCYQSYQEHFIKLSVYYAYNKFFVEEVVNKKKGEMLYDILTERVDIYRNTTLWNGYFHPADSAPHTHPSGRAKWDRIVEKLEPLFHDATHRRTKMLAGNGHRKFGVGWREPMEDLELENDAYLVLKPHLRTDGYRSFAPEYPGWRHNYIENDMNNLNRLRMQEPEKPRLVLHIYNDYMPASPLSDAYGVFALQLWNLLSDSLIKFPEIELVQMTSWLNAHPKCGALFPDTWRVDARMFPHTEVRYGTKALWGQFVTRRGDFHQLNGHKFRQSGEFPFPAIKCECHIKDAIAHLNLSPEWKRLINHVRKTKDMPFTVAELDEMRRRLDKQDGS